MRPRTSNLQGNFLEVSPEEFNAVDEIIVPFKGKLLLCQYMPKNPHKWDFKVWGRRGVFGFLSDCDIYRGKSNKKISSDFEMSSQVIETFRESLPSGHNFKIFAEKFFISLALVDEFKKSAMYFLKTVRILRLKTCLR